MVLCRKSHFPFRKLVIGLPISHFSPVWRPSRKIRHCDCHSFFATVSFRQCDVSWNLTGWPVPLIKCASSSNCGLTGRGLTKLSRTPFLNSSKYFLLEGQISYKVWQFSFKPPNPIFKLCQIMFIWRTSYKVSQFSFKLRRIDFLSAAKPRPWNSCCCCCCCYSCSCMGDYFGFQFFSRYWNLHEKIFVDNNDVTNCKFSARCDQYAHTKKQWTDPSKTPRKCPPNPDT